MRRAVFLERSYDESDTLSFRVVFWFPVPPERRETKPRFVSALHGELRPTANELQLLRSGAVREKVTTVSVNKYSESGKRPRTSQELLAEIQRQTEAQYTEELNRQPTLEITAGLYGTTYDDSVPGGWVLVVDTA